MSWEPETPQQGGKGSLAPAFTDPNVGVRRGPFGNPARLVQGLPVLDWGKQEGGIQFVKGTWKTPPVTRIVSCPARLVVSKSLAFRKKKLLGNSRRVGQDPGGLDSSDRGLLSRKVSPLPSTSPNLAPPGISHKVGTCIFLWPKSKSPHPESASPRTPLQLHPKDIGYITSTEPCTAG